MQLKKVEKFPSHWFSGRILHESMYMRKLEVLNFRMNRTATYLVFTICHNVFQQMYVFLANVCNFTVCVSYRGLQIEVNNSAKTFSFEILSFLEIIILKPVHFTIRTFFIFAAQKYFTSLIDSQGNILFIYLFTIWIFLFRNLSNSDLWKINKDLFYPGQGSNPQGGKNENGLIVK